MLLKLKAAISFVEIDIITTISPLELKRKRKWNNREAHRLDTCNYVSKEKRKNKWPNAFCLTYTIVSRGDYDYDLHMKFPRLVCLICVVSTTNIFVKLQSRRIVLWAFIKSSVQGFSCTLLVRRYFPHTNPYIWKVTQRWWHLHFELGLPVINNSSIPNPQDRTKTGTNVLPSKDNSRPAYSHNVRDSNTPLHLINEKRECNADDTYISSLGYLWFKQQHFKSKGQYNCGHQYPPSEGQFKSFLSTQCPR